MPKRTLLIAACVVALTVNAFAQTTTGIIAGRVIDQQDLPLPGATVTVSSPALQGERSAVTDPIGAFIIRGLPPGNYTVRFQFTGTSDVTEMVNVPLGGVGEVNATMRLANLQEEVRVVADITPPSLAVTQTSTNLNAEVVNALPTGRRPFEIAQLAPGVTDNTPNVGQVAVGGAFGFDSLFLVDGVDVNDNIFGQAHTLFIEDAILETQVVTGGVSAEFGRFGGGVVNVITKSGGNDFSGSFRTNFARPDWTAETPFQLENNQTNSDTLSKFFEGTVGGPIVRDRLWFFNADRYENSKAGRTLQQTGGSYDHGTKNKRFELKLTGTPIRNHTVSGSFLNSPTSETDRPSIDQTRSVDRATLINRSTPNKLWVLNWNGALTSKAFASLQWSRKEWRTVGSGGTSPIITDSPINTRGSFGFGVPAGLHYNAPFFDATDPSERNNRQVAGSVSYYLTNPAIGRHDFKVGGEYFTSWTTGGNSQSSTGYVFHSDYLVGADSRPVLDSEGRAIPVFVPSPLAAGTLTVNWRAVRGSALYIDTLSLYVQDRWQAGNRVTADIGLRFEDVNSEATGGILGADTRTWLPRLGISVDIEGNGRTVAQATFGRYSGRFTEVAFRRNTNVANPTSVIYAYVGPQGTGRDFAPGWDLANYVIVDGTFPTANVVLDPDLTSPKTDELTLSLGRELPRGGHAKVTYVWRNAGDFIEDFIDDPSGAGKVTVTDGGINFGTFDLKRFENTSVPRRDYQAVQFEGRVRAWERLPVWGNYTVQIKNHGDFEGEAGNQPGLSSVWFDYPEMLPASRYAPYGRLDEFQRHKVRLWTIYSQDFGRFGDLDISPLWRVNSGLTYSHFHASRAMSAAQRALNPGYQRANTQTNNLFFGERGSESFKGFGVLDLSFRYGVPVWKSVQPWIQAHVFNSLNNQKLIQWNTTVTADPNSPLDEIGQPTGFILGPNYGKATANTHFPAWAPGETGGRTFRLAMGIRF
jgi:hypothetical protein